MEKKYCFSACNKANKGAGVNGIHRSILILVILLAAVHAQADDLPTLAVLPVFSNGVDKTKTNIIYDYILDRVNKTKAFSLVERAALDKALLEIQFSLSDVVDEKTASRIGKISGAEYILVSSISFTEKTFYLSMRIVETETARIKNTSVKNADAFSKVESLTMDATMALFDIDSGIKATVEARSKKLTGNCYFYDDRAGGGSSLITQGIVKDGAMILDGVVTRKIPYSYVGTGIELNSDGIKLIKKAKGIRIKAKGDNQYYKIEVLTKQVSDFDYFHVTPFIANNEAEYTVLWSEIAQGGWGKKVEFKKDDIRGINFTTKTHTTGENASLRVLDIEAILQDENVAMQGNKFLRGIPNAWDDKGSKGTSKVTWEQYDDDIMHFEGTVTNATSFPFIGFAITLDENSRALVSKAKGIRLRGTGNGQFMCRIETEKVKDYNFHQAKFSAAPSFSLVEILFKDLKQETWGKSLQFEKNGINAISFQTDGKPHPSVLLKVAEIEIIPE